MSAPHYYTIVTNAGHIRLTEALATSKPVVLSHFAFGDGNGAAYDPTPDQTALRREVWRTEINSIRTDPKNPAWLTVEAVIPARVGGWTVREAGVFDSDGTLIAIAKYPESFKPQLDDGVGKDLCCRMILQHGNVSAVTLKIDPAVVLATRDHVSAEVAAAIASHAGPGHNPPDASTTVKGLVELATTAEARAGSSTHLAVTPAGLKAAMDAATIPAATPITSGIVRLATADEVKAGTDAEKAVTPAALAGHVLMQNAFIKADPDSVVFTRTAANAISLKAGTAVEVHGKAIPFATDTAVAMPTLTPGTDYAVYVCADGSVRADANFKFPSGYTAANSRKIGGFHYAPGGNATAQKGGDTSPTINPYALWDLKFRPASKDPRGMTLVADSFWADIYLLGVNHNTDGTSKYGVTIADGSSPPKIPGQFGGNGSRTYSSLNWWEAAEVMQAHGKQLPSYAEFAALAWGTTEASAPGSEPQSTVLNAAYTSRWGVIQATGCMYVWGRDFGGSSGSASWAVNTHGRGSTYQLSSVALFGGAWNVGSNAGSRCAHWSTALSNPVSRYGARGVCAHRILP